MLQEDGACRLLRVDADASVCDDCRCRGVDLELLGHEFDAGCKGGILRHGYSKIVYINTCCLRSEGELRVGGIGDLEGHLLLDFFDSGCLLLLLLGLSLWPATYVRFY